MGLLKARRAFCLVGLPAVDSPVKVRARLASRRTGGVGCTQRPSEAASAQSRRAATWPGRSGGSTLLPFPCLHSHKLLRPRCLRSPPAPPPCSSSPSPSSAASARSLAP
jgi:hypothetical protein